MKTRNDRGMGLYIHIPFCITKCAYCDFLSFECADADIQERYVQALLSEMAYARNYSGPMDIPFDTVYIGGGTPTALPTPLLCKILQEAQNFNLENNAEITIEMNPCTNAQSLLPALKASGVNRLSIGLQAWQNHLLAAIGRAHTNTDFAETIKAAHNADITNINVDLMFGLPGQTHEAWHESISQVIAYRPTHISAYSLTPAEDTPLWDALETGKAELPCEATDRTMYHKAISMLADAGYQHYELSNFAKPGFQSRHNVNCWLRRPYIGLGLGAHSFNGNTRWSNTSDMEQYLRWSPVPLGADRFYQRWKNQQNESPNRNNMAENIEHLTTKDAMAETMFLGLRLTSGINPQDFHAQFGKSLTEVYGNELETLITKGLLTHRNKSIALTPKGLDLANQVFETFL